MLPDPVRTSTIALPPPPTLAISSCLVMVPCTVIGRSTVMLPEPVCARIAAPVLARVHTLAPPDPVCPHVAPAPVFSVCTAPAPVAATLAAHMPHARLAPRPVR